ncbi:MAG TPA: 3'-5' exonuclease [Ktedonobacterales bacterium]|nr:3'-5' exonuclease [Ktedonobacterales bacterium]
MRRRERERYDALYEVRELVQQGNWVVLDVETIGLEPPEIIQWAVAAPDGTILGQGFVHPIRPITEGARAIHGIPDERVADAPPFAEAWSELSRLLAGKTVVAYNASFEREALHVSAVPYFSFLWGQPRFRWLCAMEAFACAYGDWHPYFHSYTWKTLETACHFFTIPHDQAHSAAGDARATAQVMHALAALAEQELPAGYHLPRDVACAGGCGKSETFLFGDAGDWEGWYCGACGVLAGMYHLCPQCKGTPTLLFTPDVTEWCRYCLEADKLERGEYHRCAGCGGVVEAPERVQKYHDQTCQRRAYRRRREQREEAVPEGVTPVRAGQHQLETIHEGSARLCCTICQQTWTSKDVRSVCPGVPTFASWFSVPADRFVTWTELRRRHYTTSRAVPHAAVRIIKAPYYRYLYDLQRSTPITIAPERQQAIAKAKATSQAHYTCRMCQEYYTSPDERKAFVAQVCKHCQWEVREWNRRVAWAREMIQQEAVLLEVETYKPDPKQPGQPVSCTLLDLASGTILRSGALLPEDAPALAALIDHHPTPVLTWDGEGLWALRDWAQGATGKVVLFGRMEHLAEHLTHTRQGEQVVVWETRPYENGYPVADLAWYCAAYGVEAGSTHLETMRRLVLHLAAQEPLVLTAPEQEVKPHARRTA